MCRRGWLVSVPAAVVLLGLGPAPAWAEPEPGAVTAKFSDVCGFVRADFVNADPVVAAQIRLYRNGKPLLQSGFVGGGRTESLYAVAAAEDVVGFEWQVKGGSVESLKHVHTTPAGCAEPDISVSLIDDCGLYFTVVVENTGTAAVDAVLRAPTVHGSPLHVPVGKVTLTTPGGAGSVVWLGRSRPDRADLVEVDSAARDEDCGLPMTLEPAAYFTPSCEQVAIVFFSGDMKGRMLVYRNGLVALEESVGGGVDEWVVAAAPGDVITIDDPPRASYVHAPPADCFPVPPAPSPSRAVKRRTPGPPAPAVAGPSEPVPSTTGSAAPVPADLSTPTLPRQAEPMAFVLMAIGVVLAIATLGGLHMHRRSRRRRLVWAVAFLTAFVNPSVTVKGGEPSMSVRWTAHTDAATHTLREDVEP